MDRRSRPAVGIVERSVAELRKNARLRKAGNPKEKAFSQSLRVIQIIRKMQNLAWSAEFCILTDQHVSKRIYGNR